MVYYDLASRRRGQVAEKDAGCDSNVRGDVLATPLLGELLKSLGHGLRMIKLVIALKRVSS